MNIIDCKQGTPEWWLARRGVPSASNFDRIITPKTAKLSAGADDYICELVADLHRQAPPTAADHYTSRSMLNGIDMEPEARQFYSLQADADVMEVGFCLTDDGRFGCSPDGLVGEDGGLELKCPEMKKQVAYLLAGELPAEYKPQVHGALIVSGRPWWDFLSYAHDLPPLLVRVVPDDYTKLLAQALEAFWLRYRAALATIRGLNEPGSDVNVRIAS